MFKCFLISQPVFQQRMLNILPRMLTSTIHTHELKQSEAILPSVLPGSKNTTNISNLLLSYGFNERQVKYIINSSHSILNFSEKDLISNLKIWHAFEVDNKLFTALSSHPELLTLTPVYVNYRAKELMTLFTKKDIKKLLVTCPKVFLDDFELVQEKVAYIVHSMGVEQKSIVKTEALQFDLNHIKYRHIFMSRTGFYKVKKKVVQQKTPPLNKIFSRNIMTFLKLSGLTNEEYNAFINAYEFEREMLEIDDSDDEN